MKKSIRPFGQKTLFQTWNKQAKNSDKQKSTSLFETWGATNTSTKVPQNAKRDNEKSLEALINIDDEDDNELLAAIDEIEKCANAGDNHDIGNLSFSASTSDGCEAIEGFDCSAGNSWIYPTNYPLREYQFAIVQKALFHNTLVTLPTGLGKTFIAAVVMYNFYRWYPQGKIIFMAPTKPLVAQQIDACYNIMGIPNQDTAEMTGNMAPSKRERAWQEKRVFFLTPQVFQNDLGRGSCRADDVVCLVFDEAHKALGNHSYCQVVREVLGYTKNFRILALSATPGDGIKAVQQVITNLLVSNIELRSEDSADIKPYTHQRQVEKIVVKLGDELEFFKKKFLRVLNLVVNRLFSCQALWMRDAERVNKCMLLAARDQFRKKCTAGQQPRHQIGPIEGDFAVALSLYHGYDLLLQHGLLPFYNFIKGIVDGSKGTSRAKTELTRNPDFVGILDDLRHQIEPEHGREKGNGANVKPSFIGHPKLVKLRDIILEHFHSWENTTHAGNTKGSRVMIFSQYRDSVQEIARMLSEHKPLVKAMSFIGQQSKGNASKGFTQKEQLEVIRQFRNGGYNTLVATCVGEEGLDIGEVDLIVCFDASASPIRLVQRMGRTGRKRDGRIVVLVTEGKEEQIYQRSQRNKSNIHKTIVESARTLDLYMENPRMVPKNIKPVCQKMFITVSAKTPKNKSKSTKAGRQSTDGNIKKLFSTSSEKGFLSPQELRYWNDNFKLPHHEAGLTPSKATLMRPRVSQTPGKRYLQSEPALSLTEWTAWQTPLQQVHFANHSKRSRHFTEILEFCDFRRDCGANDDSYDLEMQLYLNSEDILQPGEVEAAECAPEIAGKKTNRVKNVRKEEDVVVIEDDDGEINNNMTKKSANNKKDNGRKRKSTDVDLDTNDDDDDEAKASIAEDGTNNRRKEGRSNIGRKENESCPKKKMTDFGSDIDDDFEDVLLTNAPGKAARSDQTRLNCENISLAQKHSHSPRKKESESNHRLTINRSASIAGKNRSGNSESEFPQERNDDGFSSDDDLSGLLHIPSSQRREKVTRGRLRKASKVDDLASKELPDAPSLDTLLNLSVQNAGEELEDLNILEEEESDQDFFPTMFTDTPRTSKDKTHSSNTIGLSTRKLSDETSDNEGDKLDIEMEEISKKALFSKKSENRNQQGIRDKLGKKEPPVFGLGLVCDAGANNKESVGFGNSFFDDVDDDLDRALCNVQTPCVFDDDEGLANTEQPSNIENCPPGRLCSEAQNVSTKKYNLHTPLLFDDDAFEYETNDTKQMSKHENHFSFPPKRLYSEPENIDKKKHEEAQTPRLFDDKESESERQGIEPYSTNNRLTLRSLKYSDVHDLNSGKNQCGKNIDEKLTPPRKPFSEHNVDLDKSAELKSGVNSTSVNRIKSFHFSKSETERSLQDITSESRGKHLDIPNEYDHDVVAPSPHRVKSRPSFLGKCDKTRSFRGESCSTKGTCSEKAGDNEIKTCQNRRGMLKLKSKGIKEDVKRNEGVIGGGEACYSNNTVSKAECRDNLGESVEDSPLVVKAKGNMRSKTLRQRLLESDDEYGVELNDDGECGEENQIMKESGADFKHKSSVVCTGNFEKRNLETRIKKMHEISDSDDDEFDEPKKVERKRKFSVQEQVKKAKKRRALLDDFLDDEAEVSCEDEANDTRCLSNDEEDMEDSFIDDRTQLTQRSPLTAMKQKKNDTSVNMMDIYRISLLTPRRQQLRFQTPAFHRYKNRYKMVYDKGPPRNTFTSPTHDDDSRHNVSMETEDSNDETTVEEMDVTGSHDPEESPIIVRKNRPGKRRVLADSCLASPEAAESEHETKLSERIERPGAARSLCVEGKDTKMGEPNRPVMDDAIFKRPGNTVSVSVNKELRETDRDTTGYPGNEENFNDILAALNDSDDESLMMELNALPSMATTVVEDNTGLMVEPGTSNMQEPSRIGISSGQKNNPNVKPMSRGEGFTTSNSNNTFFASKNDSSASCDASSKLDCNAPNTSSNGSLQTARTAANQPTNVSPVFPPLATTTSPKDNTSYTHVRPEKTTGQSSSSEHTRLDTSKATTEVSVNATKASSPALTAAQRDKNKLTILVGSKEVSNCQIVSFLRRKHKMKAVVSQITGCDYIVSTRMGVERKLVSDISNQGNHSKLVERVRELCDLYDRPCIVIEKDRVKNGETHVKCQVRSKYFDRLLACFAQTHIKVLFSDGQEGTSDILSSLAKVEEKKNYAIIYPLPLSKEKEQIVKFLRSIPRTSYITAISLCYHNKTLRDIINSSADELVKRVKTLSVKRANDILKFLQHGFSADMVNCGNRR